MTGRRFDATGYERQARRILSRCDRSGRFDAIKRLMRTKLARVGWSEAFCRLSFVSEIYCPGAAKSRRRRIVTLAKIESICSVNDRLAGAPLVSAEETRELRKNRMSLVRRKALARRIETQVAGRRFPKTVEVVFLDMNGILEN